MRRTWLAESIRAKCDQHQIALWAYAFMPEHVHLLLKPRVENYDLAAFEQSAKLSFARKMIVHLTRARSTLLEKYRVKNGYKIWQEDGGHDLNIWVDAQGDREGRVLSRKSGQAAPGEVCVAVALVQFSLAGTGKTRRAASRSRMG